MDRLFKRPIDTYYFNDEEKLVCGASFDILKSIRTESIDMIFADPPYFLSNDGVTCRGGRQVSVNKGDWDKISGSRKHSFDDIHKFNRKWLRLCKRVLSQNGSIWISGTMHNIYSIGVALQQEGYKIINNITWEKTNPPPNLACRCFTHSTETILWAQKNDKKSHHRFNYELMKRINGGKQMKDVWVGSLTKRSEKIEGKHPTQKPEYLLERIIQASTQKGDMVLDPFCGSGTTGVVAKKYGRSFIGIDSEIQYIEIAKKRIEKVSQIEIIDLWEDVT